MDAPRGLALRATRGPGPCGTIGIGCAGGNADRAEPRPAASRRWRPTRPSAAAGRRGGLAGGGERLLLRRRPLEEEALDLIARVVEARPAAPAIAVEEGGAAAVQVVGLRIRAGCEEEAHCGGVAVVGGVQEGGPSGVVARVHGSGVCAQVAAEDLLVPIRGRLKQIGKVLPRRSGAAPLAARWLRLRRTRALVI